MRRRDFLSATLGAGAAALASSCGRRATDRPRGRRVLILALDGLDPRIVAELMQARRMPHLSRLAELGSFHRLRTTMPPQTPVAFSSIISGCDPGVHQIFDFIHRDPNPEHSSTPLLPFFSSSEAQAGGACPVPFTGWQLPWTAGEVALLRRGPAFWESLVRAGVDTDVYFVPANYPTAAVEVPGRFRSISGMGTPDLLGAYGEFTLFSSDPHIRPRKVAGGRFAAIDLHRDSGTGRLLGPDNYLRRTDVGNEAEPLFVDIHIARAPEAPAARIEIGGKVLVMNQGEWSEWIALDFSTGFPGSSVLSAAGAPTSVRGMVRLLLKRVHPHLELYVTPINMDPFSPVNALSSPPQFAAQLAKRSGRFFTLGIPEDTKALSSGALVENQFLSQANLVLEEHEKIYREALREFQSGCMFFYFGTPDLVQHMFWRDRDPQHPAHVPEEAEEYGSVVDDLYVKMDEYVGDALDALSPEDTLIVLSDHGFTSFRRGFNLNSWLADNGFLRRSNWQGGDLFNGVDWSATRAYGVGMNGLYLNLRDREKYGAVDPTERRSILGELVDKLCEIRDRDGSRVIETVLTTEQDYSGADPSIAPDLILGYAEGFRASWATTLGGMPREVLEDNMDRWSGTHLISADRMPGILVTSRPVAVEDPSVLDIAPTILGLFEVRPPESMHGRRLFG